MIKGQSCVVEWGCRSVLGDGGESEGVWRGGKGAGLEGGPPVICLSASADSGLEGAPSPKSGFMLSPRWRPVRCRRTQKRQALTRLARFGAILASSPSLFALNQTWPESHKPWTTRANGSMHIQTAGYKRARARGEAVDVQKLTLMTASVLDSFSLVSTLFRAGSSLDSTLEHFDCRFGQFRRRGRTRGCTDTVRILCAYCTWLHPA